MSLAAFCRLLRSRWHGLANSIWPDSFAEQVQAELGLLDGELRRRHDRLVKYRQKTEKIRYSLQRRELRPQSLAVDRLRRRLAERERKYQESLLRFDRWKQERKAVRDLLIRHAPADVRVVEEESDFGYPF
jgi:hypothetical protein